MTAKTNDSFFDDPRGLVGNTEDVSFGSPVSVSQIVFAALREPVAKRVVVDVAFDMMAKGFKVEEETEEPNVEWTRQVSRVLDELDTKEKLRELVIFERLYGWATLGISFIERFRIHTCDRNRFTAGVIFRVRKNSSKGNQQNNTNDCYKDMLPIQNPHSAILLN